ncbi:DUF1934 domain-containing protein [Peribacillus sp. B-H-3]|uniref:DUF1934 domain-containing protein n=1 Tax=Peribacillus sp. B-H-3 TaxID=3400420 RepID=UPI003B01BB5E
MTLQDSGKKNIKVTLQTKIRNGSGTESYELITFGTMFFKAGSLYLQYGEENEYGKTQTTIKYKGHEALLLRNGAVKMRQSFVPEETVHGHYESVYGTLGMITHTNSLEYQWNEDEKEGKLVLNYELTMQGSEKGYYEMTIAFREEA